MSDFIIDNRTLIKYTGTSEEVIIPNDITIIGAFAFVGSKVNCVIIPEGVVEIAHDAFYECIHLTSVSMPKSVKTIGPRTFGYCRNLKDIVIPEGVRYIGEEAFIGCSGLTSVTMRYGVIEIASRCFANCASLTSFFIPNSVKRMGYGLFENCRNLTSVNLPKHAKDNTKKILGQKSLIVHYK